MRHVCAWCHKDMETGRILSPEEYEATRTLEANVSHTICEECGEKAREK